MSDDYCGLHGSLEGLTSVVCKRCAEQLRDPFGVQAAAAAGSLADAAALKRKPLVHVPGHDNLPPGLTQQERDAADAPGVSAAALESAMEASPTGKPLISPKAVPWLALLVAAASAVALGQPDLIPDTSIDQTVAQIIVSLGAVFGILSPGMRKAA